MGVSLHWVALLVLSLLACAGRETASDGGDKGGASGAGAGGVSDGGTLAGGVSGGALSAGEGGGGSASGGAGGMGGSAGDGSGGVAGDSGRAGAGGASGAQAAGAGGVAGEEAGSAGVAGTAGVAGAEAGAGGTGGGGLNTVTLFLMVDRSWSMNECADPALEAPDPDAGCTDGGPSRWDLTALALEQFVQDPGASGLGVALRFFPHDAPAEGCDGYSDFDMVALNCDSNACAEPLVDAARLTDDAAPTDAQEAALVAAIAASAPPGPDIPVPSPGTPTYPALIGAATWATAYQSAHPAERTLVVLVTDGEPVGCDENVANIAAVAADARALGVSTYVIGIDESSTSALEPIASAGGTVALFVGDGASLADDLLATLRSVAAGP